MATPVEITILFGDTKHRFQAVISTGAYGDQGAVEKPKVVTLW
jgi:hypothetical protein